VRLFRYLLRGVLVRWVVALPVLVLTYLVFFLGDQGRLMAGRVGWATALKVGLLHLPMIVVQVIPVALMLGAVLAAVAWRQRGELEALSAFGAGPARLWPPLIVAGLVSALVALAVDELAVPPCERAADRLQPGAVTSSLTGLAPPPGWFRRGAWIFRLEGERVTALQIEAGFRLGQRIDGVLDGGSVRRAVVTRFSERGIVERERRDHVALPELAGVGRLRSTSRTRAEAMAATDLSRHLDELRRAGQSRTADALVLHGKLAFPALSLVVALFGCAFLRPAPGGVRPVRDLAWASLVLVGLWCALALGWLIARAGWISAGAGAWGPVLVSGAVALAILWLRRA